MTMVSFGGPADLLIQSHESMHKSKLTSAPYWLTLVKVGWLHNGFPSTGQRFVTLTTIVLGEDKGFPLESCLFLIGAVAESFN